MNDPTVIFRPISDKDAETKQLLGTVYDAVAEKGYDAANQIIGYLLSEDPTYITTNRNARSLIALVDRDDLLKKMLLEYLGK